MHSQGNSYVKLCTNIPSLHAASHCYSEFYLSYNIHAVNILNGLPLIVTIFTGVTNMHMFLRSDSIDLLFLGSSCTFMKWQTENNLKKIEILSQIIVFSCKFLPLFPFISYPSRPFQMGPGKI